MESPTFLLNQQRQPSMVLRLNLQGDEAVVPLEYPCEGTQGAPHVSDSLSPCPQCDGRGVVLAHQGRLLLHFLKKWGASA